MQVLGLNLLSYLEPQWVHRKLTVYCIEYQLYAENLRYDEFTLVGALTKESINDWNKKLHKAALRKYLQKAPQFVGSEGPLMKISIYHKSPSWRLLFY